MVGLSVVLEGRISGTTGSCSSTSSQVLNKASIVIKTSPTSPTPSSSNPFSKRASSLSTTNCGGFLDNCFLCKEKLLPAKDIYMYKGDRGFCSEQCRQMYMDEEETKKPKTKRRDNNCSLVAIDPQLASPSSSRSKKGAVKD